MLNLSWAKSVQDRANDNDHFATAARWLDLTLVIRFGPTSYWFKLYRGRIIDAEPYNPVVNRLGYDVLLSGEADTWKAARDGGVVFGRLLSVGAIFGDGNRVEVERSFKAVHVLGAIIIPACGLPPEIGD